MLQIHTLLLELFETVVFLLLAVESLGEESGSALARGEHHHLQPLPEAGLFRYISHGHGHGHLCTRQYLNVCINVPELLSSAL